MRPLTAGLIAALALTCHGAFAAQQLVPTQTLLVKNPPSGARKVLWKFYDLLNLVGNPITEGGATLHIKLTPGDASLAASPSPMSKQDYVPAASINPGPRR